jgi:uncharacterized protein YxjI
MLDKKLYFIREHVAMLKLTDTYDILDPTDDTQIGIAREEPPVWAKYLRLLLNKNMLPTTVNIYEKEGSPPLFSIHKPVALFVARVEVYDGTGQLLGFFKGKFFSLGGGFWVHDAQGNQIAEVKGDWKGWDFKFINNAGAELGSVTKKWAGLGKELFTTADNYMVSLADEVAGKKEMSALLLAAALAVDIVYKEGS